MSVVIVPRVAHSIAALYQSGNVVGKLADYGKRALYGRIDITGIVQPIALTSPTGVVFVTATGKVLVRGTTTVLA